MKPRTKRVLIVVAGVYAVLWAVTAIFAPAGIDKDFDREFAVGYKGMWPRVTEVAIQRIPFTPMRDMNNFPPNLPGGFFRCRSRGVAIAPFVVVDEAVWINGSLSAFSGHRIVLWFFGFTKAWPIYAYWVS